MTPKERKLRVDCLNYIDDTRSLARRLPADTGSLGHQQAVMLMAACSSAMELLVAELDLARAREKYEQQMAPPRPPAFDHSENLHLKAPTRHDRAAS